MVAVMTAPAAWPVVHAAARAAPAAPDPVALAPAAPVALAPAATAGKPR